MLGSHQFYASKNHCTVSQQNFVMLLLRTIIFLRLCSFYKNKYVGSIHRINQNSVNLVTHNTEIISLRFIISVYGAQNLQFYRQSSTLMAKIGSLFFNTLLNFSSHSDSSAPTVSYLSTAAQSKSYSRFRIRPSPGLPSV